MEAARSGDVLSHTASKAKFVDYLLMRSERNDPVLQQQRKLQAQAEKLQLLKRKRK